MVWKVFGTSLGCWFPARVKLILDCSSWIQDRTIETISCLEERRVQKQNDAVRWFTSLLFAFRHQNDNPLAICSCCCRLLLDSITPYFGLSLHRYYHLSCSLLALPRSFNEAASSYRSASIRRTYTLRCRVGIPGVEQYRLSADRLLSSATSPVIHEKYVRELGRNVRLRGIHPVRTCCVAWGCAR